MTDRNPDNRVLAIELSILTELHPKTTLSLGMPIVRNEITLNLREAPDQWDRLKVEVVGDDSPYRISIRRESGEDIQARHMRTGKLALLEPLEEIVLHRISDTNGWMVDEEISPYVNDRGTFIEFIRSIATAAQRKQEEKHIHMNRVH